MRHTLIKELKKNIKLRECVHIKTKPGLGTTTLLKSLPGVYAESRPLKPIISALAKGKKGTISELKQVIDYEQTLLLDDVQEATNQIKRFIKKAMNQGLIIISAGTKNVFRFPELELKPLNKKEAIKLVNKHLKNKELARVIVNELGGNPSLLMKAVRKALARNDLRTINGFNQFKQSINSLIKRKDLLSISLLAMIYPVTQSIRHLLYAQREYQLGHWMAMGAYIIMLLKNIKKR